MPAPLHTPYDGSSRPFTVGVKPIDKAAWLEVGNDIDPYLAEKDRLNAAVPAAVFVEERDTRGAQAELLELLAGYLPERCPDIYRLDGNAMLVGAGGRRVPLDDPSIPPLRSAADMVADDLVLMRRGETGWRLAAASLCFPSSWTLSEKFGRPLQDIHEPVPGFGRGTRTADIINRIFDNLPPNLPAIRWNWSLQDDAGLYKPFSSVERDERAVARPARFPAGAAGVFIRVERQTLRKLPVSGDIVFTIGIHLDPLAELGRHPEGAALATSLAGQLDGLDAAQLAYKGLAADRDRLSAELRALAAAQPNARKPVSSLL